LEVVLHPLLVGHRRPRIGPQLFRVRVDDPQRAMETRMIRTGVFYGYIRHAFLNVAADKFASPQAKCDEPVLAAWLEAVGPDKQIEHVPVEREPGLERQS